MSPVLKIGTRGSRLALWQAEWVRERLAQGGVATEVVIIKTQGDAEVDRPLHELAGKGFFTKGIEDALLDGRVDLAVHSLKDLPTALPDGLLLGAVPERADPRDVLVVKDDAAASLAALAPGSRVGTSSLRRVAQVRHLRADLEIVPLRGNVPTRVQKVKEGRDLDAALLGRGRARAPRADSRDRLDARPARSDAGSGAGRARDRDSRARRGNGSRRPPAE